MTITKLLLFFNLLLIGAVHLTAQPDDLQEQPLDSVLSWMQINYSDDSIDMHAIGMMALERAADSDDLRLKADLHIAIADWLGYTGFLHQDTLIRHTTSALGYYEQLGDTKKIADTYRVLSMDLLSADRFDDSQEATFKSIALYEELDDQDGIADAHRSLAYLHQRMEEPLISIDYAKKAYDYYNSAEQHDRKSYTLLSLIRSYQDAGMYKESRAAGEECIQIVNEKVPEEVFVLGRAYAYLGDLSVLEEDYDRALAETKQAFDIVEREIGEERASSYNAGIADVLRLQGKWQSAIDIYLKVVSYAEIQGKNEGLIFYNSLYECYKNLGDEKNALKYHEIYMQDQMARSEAKIKNLKGEAVIKYATAQKDQEIAVQEAEIKQQSRTQKLSYGALAVLLGLLGSLFYFFRQNKKVTAALNVKNEENEILVKEIHHRVKNNLQILSSLLSLQSGAEDNEEVLGALQEGRNRVESMGMIHQRLYNKDTLSAINMKEYVPELCEYLQSMTGQKEKGIKITSDVQVGLTDIETAIPLGLILNELITNSVKYAYAVTGAGVIRVKLWLDDDQLLCLKVSDNGSQDSSQNSDIKSTNFGSKLVGILSKKLKGKVEVDTTNGYTTTITFSRFKLV